MKDILTQEFINEHGRPVVFFTDPPRAGRQFRDTKNRKRKETCRVARHDRRFSRRP